MLDLTVSIVNWNTKNLLKACLASIFNQTEGLNYHVWVVDNGSSDGSVQMIEREFPQVRLIKNSVNLGFTKTNNQVLRQCEGNYVLLLNSDTQVVGNALKELIDFMEVHPEAGAAGCQLLNKDGSLQLSCGRFPTLTSVFFGAKTCNRIFRRIFGKRTFFAEYGLSEQEHLCFQEVDFVKGCCIILRKSVLEKTDFLDENIFMYFEEMDLCYRIKQQGNKILYTPQPKVIHLGGQSDRFDSKTVSKRLNSQEYFFRKHYGNTQAFFLKLVIALGTLLRFPLFLVIYGFRRKGAEMKTKMAWSLYTLKYLTEDIFGGKHKKC
jgi:GT2 family glycosyltransferase